MQFNDWVEYQRVRKPWTATSESLTVLGFGLAGETGEVLEHFKKWARDGSPDVSLNEKLALEFGDVLFYWLKLLQFTGYTVEQVLQLNADKLAVRDAMRGKL